MSATGIKIWVTKAKQAISAIESDTSVSQEVTLEALEEINEDVEMRIDALKESMDG